MKTIKNDFISEEYYSFRHRSGLQVFVYPKNGYEGTYAIFGTNYGSVDETFKPIGEDEYLTVPSGIAHFLEHKLFESEKGDAFSRYAKTGASANAYTSFDKTCYLFTCSENVPQSLEILLDFVTSPYFTAETVEKEQGIIGEEIRMYDDSADWQVFFGLLRALYVNHPIKTDIAGTQETIAEIDAGVLYKCYNTFYNLNNMALCVVGNITTETVNEIADKILKKSDCVTVDCKPVSEPESVCEKKITTQMEVVTPLFQMGYKLPCDGYVSAKTRIACKVLSQALLGDSSTLYRQLLDMELINSQFGTDVLEGRGFAAFVAGGESKNPDKVYEIITKAVQSAKNNGIGNEDFMLAKKSVYGHLVSGFNSIENIGGSMVEAHFGGTGIFEMLNEAVNIKPQDIDCLLKSFDNDSSALSVVFPKTTENS